MKQRKIFLGVAIPRDVSKRLTARIKKWSHSPFRFTKEGNLHITLLFLGHVLDESVAEVCERVDAVCKDVEAFDVDFDTITLTPEQGREAKTLWYDGEPSEELRNLREAIEKELDMFSAEKKAFRPHITLGRVRKNLWQALNEIPEIHESLALSIPIDSVIVYEAIFRKGEGLIYDVLAECPLIY